MSWKKALMDLRDKMKPNDIRGALTTKEVGQSMELVAAEYLKQQGLTLIATNFSCRFGEIDLILQEQQILVFVEVKYRQSAAFGGAINAISPTKREKIIKTAQIYMQQAKLNEYNTCCRFDVVAIQGTASHPDISWLKNAF